MLFWIENKVRLLVMAFAAACSSFGIVGAQDEKSSVPKLNEAYSVDQRKDLVIDHQLARYVVANIPEAEQKLDEKQAKLFAKFKRLLTGAKLRGQFTVDGKPLDKLTEETYEISKVEKMPQGDIWVITARIKYGKHDLTFPVPLEVKWAGNTPVMTLDDMTIPGFGTFGARVVFHKDKYAGTWQHDNVGGHMFGVVEMPKEAEKNDEKKSDAKSEAGSGEQE